MTDKVVTMKPLDEGGSCFSQVFMTYLDTLFEKGFNSPLELDDLGGVPEIDRCDLKYKVFAKVFKEAVDKNPKQTLWPLIWRTVGWYRLFSAIGLFAISAALGFAPVMILERLVKNFAGFAHYTDTELWVMVTLLFVFPMSASLCLAHSNNIMAHTGAQVRNFLIDAIYRKSLRLSSASRQSVSTGKIVTMFSEDTNQIRAFLFFVCNTAVAPLQIAACLYLIYQQVGPATFVGLGFTFVTMPLNGMVFGMVAGFRKQKMGFTDMRVKLMSEILNGIRIIKYYAWEGAFMEKLTEIRTSELKIIEKSGMLFNTAFAFLLLGAPNIQTVLIFFTFIADGNQQLTASIAFTTLTLFALMTSPFIFLPFGLQQYSTSLVASKRIMDFLLTDELEDYICPIDEAQQGYAIVVDEACLSWMSASELATVKTAEAESNDVTPASPVGSPVKLVAAEAHLSDAATPASKQQTVGVGVQVAATVEGANVKGEPEPLVHRSAYTLRDVSLKIKTGSLVGVVGAVGAGKSSFLNALLGEMHCASGKVAVTKDAAFAYCDQRPWIVNATVKDNITFGREFDEDRFNKAIYASCMEDDLKILSDGVNTEIGERGINLSGGQKARVALARAVYNDADIYLLDDPLSAVDAHVGQHIFSKCIQETLTGKTRVLVTHHIHCLPQCDQVIILEDGRVKVAGSYLELVNSGVDITQYIPHCPEDEEGGMAAASASASGRKKSISNAEELDIAPNAERKSSHGGRNADVAEDAKTKGGAVEAGALTTKEEKAEGSVSWRTYARMIEYGGYTAIAGTMFGQFTNQILNINANFWLADWGLATTKDSFGPEGEMSRRDNFDWFHGYAGMQMAAVFFLLVSRLSLVRHRLNSSRVFHEKLLHQVLGCSVSFFDITPVGRIVNRFSQDMATIDEELAQTVSQTIGMGGSCLGAVGAIIGATKGTFIGLIVPLAFLYSRFRSYFAASNTAIARLEAVTRSPIYSDFSQVLGGTSTIRAYAQESRFITRIEGYANSNTVPGIMQQVGGQWLAIRLDFLGALIIFAMGCLAVATKDYNFIDAGDLGLGLSYSISLTFLLKMAVKVSSTMEAQMNAVERVNHYIDTLENEGGMHEKAAKPGSDKCQGDDGDKKKPVVTAVEVPPGCPMDKTSYQVLPNGGGDVSSGSDARQIELATVPGASAAVAAVDTKTEGLVDVPLDWPSQGKIEFRDVSMRYRQGPLVLKGVSFDVAPKEKVGFCGRTGCGKSSLMVALFRIEKLSGGSIIIDGLDIARVPLGMLRSKLCIIPQDPVMFSASVRFNLDPFSLNTDTELWEVLESVDMKPFITSLPGKLEELISEGGENFSAGQRQLVCIARALLRKPKILVMDEATASIDTETDALVQRMVRDRFKDCTVLTIAHRLDTIFDSDKIAALNSGLLMEYGSAKTLLENKDGLFKGLWEKHQQENKH